MEGRKTERKGTAAWLGEIKTRKQRGALSVVNKMRLTESSAQVHLTRPFARRYTRARDYAPPCNTANATKRHETLAAIFLNLNHSTILSRINARRPSWSCHPTALFLLCNTICPPFHLPCFGIFQRGTCFCCSRLDPLVPVPPVPSSVFPSVPSRNASPLSVRQPLPEHSPSIILRSSPLHTPPQQGVKVGRKARVFHPGVRVYRWERVYGRYTYQDYAIPGRAFV